MNLMKIDTSFLATAAIVPVEMPIGLRHIDSDLCWCDPTIEVEEDGQEMVIHRQVTWN